MKRYATTAARLGLAAACLSNCADKKETPEPLPEPTATYRRTWTYLDQALPARRDSTYQTASLAPTAEQDAASLFVALRTRPNQEGIVFRIDRSHLTANLTGTYTYQTLLNHTTTDVDLNYYVVVPGTNTTQGWTYGTLINPQLAGSFTITAYDAKRQLLSGQFSAQMPNASDPTDTDNTPDPLRRCGITLTGSFINLPITARQ